jgi:hypothetical protein
MNDKCLAPESVQQAPLSGPVETTTDTVLYYPYRLARASHGSLLRRLVDGYEFAYQKVVNHEFTLDITTKFNVLFTRAPDDAGNRVRIHIRRLDNLSEQRDQLAAFAYKPIDLLWRRSEGWPEQLTLFTDEGWCVRVPKSERETMSFDVALPSSFVLRRVARYEGAVPRRLFQTWIWPSPVESSKDAPPPLAIRKAMATFRELNPDWCIPRYSSHGQLRSMIEELEGQEAAAAFDALKPAAFRVDLWRYVVLYHHGGVYADCKLSLVAPLSTLVPKEGGLVVDDIRGAGTLNGFIAVPPRHPLMRAAIDGVLGHVRGRYYGNHILGITGPVHLHRCLQGLSADQQSSLLHLRFDNTGITARRHARRRVSGNSLPPTLILVHNAEYRRLYSRPGMANHYEEIYLARTVYGEAPSNIPDLSSPSLGSAVFGDPSRMLAGLLVLVLIACLTKHFLGVSVARPHQH